MEQQLDVFTQKRFELMVEMATKKMQAEIASVKETLASVKETLCSMAGELNSLKSQMSRLQFQQPSRPVQTTLFSEQKPEQQAHIKRNVEIVDCRPEEERKSDFKSGAEKNTEPVRPRYGDYEPKDVSIDKFFYFGRK